jgi:hypothetical protein
MSVDSNTTKQSNLEKIVEIFRRDGAVANMEYLLSLRGKMGDIRSDTRIKFTCICGKNGEKPMADGLKKTGAFCKKCTQETAKTKRIETTKTRYGVESVAQVKEFNDKKVATMIANNHPNKPVTFDEFIQRSKDAGLYDCWIYNFTEVVGFRDTDHSMTHKQCGKETLKTLKHHLEKDDPKSSGQGCRYCFEQSNVYDVDEFIRNSIEKYGKNIYDYSYLNTDKIYYDGCKYTLYCNIHKTPFKTTYRAHIYGKSGCPTCVNNMFTKKTLIDKYGEQLLKNGVQINLDDYEDSDKISLRQKYSCKCLFNSSHKPWKSYLYHLIKTQTGCPSCGCSASVSKAQIEYLKFMSVLRPNLQYAKHKTDSESEYKIPGTRYKSDGFDELSQTVVEYHGCIWHGCKKCCNPVHINPVNKSTYAELFEMTQKKKNILVEKGYTYYEMWECDWDKAINALRKLQKKWIDR